MAYSTTSKYVQLTSYLVMEYMYADQPNPENYNVNSGSTIVSYNKLINGIIKGPNNQPTNQVQIFNQNQNYSTTKNTAQNNVVKVSENSFIPLNPNYIIPYNDFNSSLTSSSDLPVSFSSNFSITYDTVRYHILAGYNLENIDGLVLGIDFLDIDGSYVTFSQIFLDNGFSSEYVLNPNPVTIGINSYDKYFEIKIPSLLFLNNQYISSPTPSLTPSALLSKSGQGFVVGSPMRFRVYQVLNTTLTTGYVTYGVNLINTLSLESEDPFENIGAFIGPADTGDFFEFFATDNGGFIENFILFQNSIGNQYYIQNEIKVFEQIGTALLQTSNFYTIQTGAYDIPNLYRPIIKNSGIASSFTLRYTMTLVNSVDQSRLIRTASYTYNNPAKYGTYIAPLQLQNLPQVQKIYNKVANQASISVPNSNPTPRIIIKYSDVYIERNLVNVTQTNLTVEGNNVTSSTAGAASQTVYGQGKVYITISPFDNYFKFTFYKKLPSGDTQFIDLESGKTYHMVFINNSNQKVSVPSLTSKNIANSAKGEVAFKVPETISNDVLQYTNRKFYITNRPPGSVAEDTFGATGGAGEGGAGGVGGLNITTGTLTVFSSSSSVLYWGNWLKEGESPPSVPAGPTASSGPSTRFLPKFTTREVVGQSAFQAIGTASVSEVVAVGGGSTQVSDPRSTPTSKPPLPISQFQSAITTTVLGMLAQKWSTLDIINYFLNPTQPGYTLFKGITKEIFTTAVTSYSASGTAVLFTDDQLAVLRNYGNTGAGTTTGGAGSVGGSSVNQNGSDSGTANQSRGGSKQRKPTIKPSGEDDITFAL